MWKIVTVGLAAILVAGGGLAFAQTSTGTGSGPGKTGRATGAATGTDTWFGSADSTDATDNGSPSLGMSARGKSGGAATNAARAGAGLSGRSAGTGSGGGPGTGH